MSYEAPFAGLRVLDVSQGIAAPYAAMLLAQYGADVVKVEPPGGDWSRMLGARHGDHTAFSLSANLGKRSIALDLASDEGRRVVRRLAARADVFVESFRPGGAARLGVGYEDVAALSPRIVYLSVSGFGQTGPERDRPAVDTVVQAFTGLMAVNKGAAGSPHRVGTIVMDTNDVERVNLFAREFLQSAGDDNRFARERASRYSRRRAFWRRHVDAG